ncbi:energy-coupling factor transporter transmembrane component T family protein [Roseovarius aestuarii]|uniref:Energy-coupling factor transporter transmembrane protein BioN n=1 Tax=Roseovarius aestuarii TaxID=475083 RepID=A0A1X7BKM7_9RHOB|nr:energy-coupling factor transporter transmembrane component T [Roseovarius aestuarii]SMC10211.1 Energy-coupling factor transporter transmembrane protein BioN [Roseovarius aestuarii]
MISLTSPVRTKAHDWPAGLKLAGLCASTLVLFYIRDPAMHFGLLLLVLGLYALPGRRFMDAGLRQLRILWPFALVVAVWHLWSGEIATGATVILRLVSAVALANLVTMTTRLSDMIDVLHGLSRPLRRFGLRPRVLELAIALVIRLTPVLLQKGTLLSEAWQARSRRRSGWRIILPFTVLALDDAEHVAEALRARGGFNTQECH